MQLGEKYGIHPLHMIGHAGTFAGTGGGNLGEMVQDERKSRQMRKAYEEDRDFNANLQKDLKEMDIAAEDARLTRQLNENKTNPRSFGGDMRYIQNYFGIDPRQIANDVEEDWNDTKEYMKRFQGKGRQAPPIR